MSDIAIKVENLSKRFQIGTASRPAYHRLSEAIAGAPQFLWNACRGLVPGSSVASPDSENLATDPSEFWAVKDVSFEVKQGEVVGIIGRNGSGKSTLLKILSRITEPTSGRFGVRGRVASLLEVGTGFHPELTGRENIYVSGVTLGMTRTEIKKRFDEIVDFSGVEKFLDTPVKHYSSGMQVRLGFAVAAHLESDILIVDEVLAVGDAEFQRKCLNKIGRLSSSGKTAIFVSHNIAAIESICSQAIWIEKGEVVSGGMSTDVLNAYQSATGSHLIAKQVFDSNNAPGSDHVDILKAEVRSIGEDTPNPSITRAIEIVFSMFVRTPQNLLNPSVIIENDNGVIVLNSFPPLSGSVFEEALEIGEYHCAMTIPPNLLNDELYRVHLYVIRDRYSVELKIEDALRFQPRDDTLRDGWYGKWPGVVRPTISWHTSNSCGK